MFVACRGRLSLDRGSARGEEVQVKLRTSFYAGMQYYLDEGFVPREEDAEEFAQGEKVQAAYDRGDIRVTLEGLGIDWADPVLETETALADDQPGQPFLLYINATFDVPPAYADELAELEDELDDLLTAVLHSPDVTLPFQGVYELEFEDD